MAWTEITRPKYRRDGPRFASDTTGEEWTLIEPRLPPPANRGRRRETSLRDVVDANHYIAESGRQWRLLPQDFPPYSTVQRHFHAWRNNGLWQTMNHVLLMAVREDAGAVAAGSGAPARPLADRAFADFGREPGFELCQQAHTPPAHGFVCRRAGSLDDRFIQFGRLLPCQKWRAAGAGAGSRPFDALLVAVMNPIAQCLAIHAVGRCGPAARTATQNPRQSQKLVVGQVPGAEDIDRAPLARSAAISALSAVWRHRIGPAARLPSAPAIRCIAAQCGLAVGMAALRRCVTGRACAPGGGGLSGGHRRGFSLASSSKPPLASAERNV